MKIAFLLYPTEHVRPDEDSSFWMIHELLRRGHQVYTFESKDLVLINEPKARLRKARTNPRTGFIPSPLSANFCDLKALDAVFIRKEPPFDAEYVSTLQILSHLKGQNLVLNDPAGILLCNEKIGFPAARRYFPEDFCGASPDDLERFARRAGGRVVLKPLDNRSGNGVIAASNRDKNFRAIVQTMTAQGTRHIVAQRYVLPGNLGERRIVVLNGEILGVFRRKPHPKDFRANLGLGGSMHRAAVSVWDRRMVQDLAAELDRLGLYFVGIDACGEKILEINVTSPSGLPELNQLNRAHLEKKVADFIERKARR